MKILNLVNQDSGDIAYKISKFPDGQQNVTITGSIGYTQLLLGEEIQIKGRLNNFKDLEIIICTTTSLRISGFKKISLYIPYILGARSDRQFQHGENSYLRDVIAPILNAQNYEYIKCIDVHSDVAAACIDNLIVEDNKNLVISAINNFYDIIEGWNEAKPTDKFVLISPDGGSLKKIYKAADSIGYKEEIITCSKSRDTKGKLSNIIVPFSTEKTKGKDFIIIDDICDGGRTFINIAQVIKGRFEVYDKGNFNSKIYLIITHGIFSAGFVELGKLFDGIYCTNSYSDIGDEWFDGWHEHKTNVKQLDVY